MGTRFACIVGGPDIGAEGISIWLTITNGGRRWSYRGFAEEDALATLGDNSDMTSLFESKKGFFCDSALARWDAQPESDRYMITLENVETGGDFVKVE